MITNVEGPRRRAFLLGLCVALSVAAVGATPASARTGGSERAASPRLLAPGAGFDGRNQAAVARLQRRLLRLGYGPGPVDGLYGPLTAGAVTRLQAANRVAVDGIAGPVTQKVLRLQSRPSATVVRRAQRRLRRLGHRPGQVDGIFGPRTVRAVQRFKSASGLSGAARLNQRVLARLSAATTRADATRAGERTSTPAASNDSPGQSPTQTVGERPDTARPDTATQPPDAGEEPSTTTTAPATGEEPSTTTTAPATSDQPNGTTEPPAAEQQETTTAPPAEEEPETTTPPPAQEEPDTNGPSATRESPEKGTGPTAAPMSPTEDEPAATVPPSPDEAAPPASDAETEPAADAPANSEVPTPSGADGSSNEVTDLVPTSSTSSRPAFTFALSTPLALLIAAVALLLIVLLADIWRPRWEHDQRIRIDQGTADVDQERDPSAAGPGQPGAEHDVAAGRERTGVDGR
jgi:peptidoglycan hydrolase-like protein with peptidoglycan-binding domain